MRKDFIFTSESVSEGHPDKVSDRISDAVVDHFIAKDHERPEGKDRQDQRCKEQAQRATQAAGSANSSSPRGHGTAEEKAVLQSTAKTTPADISTAEASKILTKTGLSEALAPLLNMYQTYK